MKQLRTIRGNGAMAGRRRWVAAVGLAGIVLLGACGDGTDAGSTGPERATTTSKPRVSTTVGNGAVDTTPTTRPAVDTTPTTRPADSPPGEPRVVASPPAAAPNTRVSITGDGFTDEHWQTPGVPLWLAGGPSDCDFYAPADHDVQVSADGHLSGSFAVPDHGDCRQSSTSLPIEAGTYRTVYQCTACIIGEFDVTAGGVPASAECNDVAFSPNSDNLASSIRTYGPSCEEADAVVREVGGPFGPINGAARGEAGGFTCVRTGQEDAGLPSATYECTRGGQRITFVRRRSVEQ